MTKSRLEAFSDGVLAVIITIMVLELKAPHESGLSALWAEWPVFLSYVLSFLFIGIYWNNHHHMLHAAHKVNGLVMWANLHLLFWLSLVPFTTAWLNESFYAATPVAVYGVVLLMSGIAYYGLEQSLIALQGRDSTLAKAIGGDAKGIISVMIYAAAIGVAFFQPYASMALYAIVAAMWIVPDQRIERVFKG
jgi:uncharacterized membrane protein